MSEAATVLSAPGITAQFAGTPVAASLRYFTASGEFAAALARDAGTPLPAPGAAVGSAGLVLAWRTPTETLCLARDAARLGELRAALAPAGDGCLVELTGGLSLVSLAGARIGDLLCRIGSSDSLPRPGEARRSRMADVPVLALCLTPGEVELLVERAFAPHLLGWIRETLLDFA
jgi:sarcosine oxidase gamma subunit